MSAFFSKSDRRKRVSSAPLDPKANFALIYACGRLVHQVADAQLKNKGGVVELWKRMLASLNSEGSVGHKYINADMYFTALKQAGVRESDVNDLRKFVFQMQTDPMKSISALFDSSEMRFRLKPDPADNQKLKFVP